MWIVSTDADWYAHRSLLVAPRETRPPNRCTLRLVREPDSAGSVPAVWARLSHEQPETADPARFRASLHTVTGPRSRMKLPASAAHPGATRRCSFATPRVPKPRTGARAMRLLASPRWASASRRPSSRAYCATARTSTSGTPASGWRRELLVDRTRRRAVVDRVRRPRPAARVLDPELPRVGIFITLSLPQ
jgi:hypothetical protein